MKQNIYLEKRECYQYPESDDGFSPDKLYPEYPFSESTLSSRHNEVYDMVRMALYGLGLDSKNFGSVEWNPLGDYVGKNSYILIKPNFVNHENPEGGLDCTVTHPSVLRCIIDYCVIAGAKIIEVADAPIQNCDFDKLMIIHGYKKVFGFFSDNDINIEVTDLRMTISQRLPNGVFLQEKHSDIYGKKTCEFDLKELSFFNTLYGKQNYGVANYSDEAINLHHNNGHHKYLVSKSVLEADLIINLPKPKTHRFAAITGAQKNFIGICSDKEYLPHFRSGSPETKGDEYDQSTLLNKIISKLNKQRCLHIDNNNYKMQLFYIKLIELIKRIAKVFFIKEQKYSSGQWYGNDTIWRTTLDLNLIAMYGDSSGSINLNKAPRNILNIGDLIIAGEKNGPLQPLPKKLGIILASDNCVIFDYIFCKITGFDFKIIPTIKHSITSHYLLSRLFDEIILYSNLNKYNKVQINSDFEFPKEWNFIPHPLWNEVLQKE